MNPNGPLLSGLRRAVLAIGWASIALAHDPFEITADARLRADGLELVVTMAPSTAMAISSADGTPERFPPDEFEKLWARFAAGGARLFEVTGGGKRIAVRRVTVGLAREFDVEFRLSFPAPARGPLRLRAAHLARLQSGYGDVLTLHTGTGELLGQRLLMRNDLTMEVPLPPGFVAAAATRPKPTLWSRFVSWIR